MSIYELTYILKGNLTPAKIKSVNEQIEKVIKTADGKIIKTNDIGKIELAYKIKKQNYGIFISHDLEFPSDAAKKFNEKLKTEDDIIRYLFIRKDITLSKTKGK